MSDARRQAEVAYWKREAAAQLVPPYVPPTLDDLAYLYGKPRATQRAQDRDLREVAREEYFPA